VGFSPHHRQIADSARDFERTPLAAPSATPGTPNARFPPFYVFLRIFKRPKTRYHCLFFYDDADDIVGWDAGSTEPKLTLFHIVISNRKCAIRSRS